MWEPNWTLYSVAAAVVLGARGYLALRVRREIRRAGPESDSYAIFEACWRSFGAVATCAVMLVFGILRGASSEFDALSGVSAWLIALLAFWWIYAGFARDQSRLHGALRGPEWDAPIHRALAALTLGPLVGVPICAAGITWLTLFVSGGTLWGAPLAPLAAFSVYPGLVVWAFWAQWVAKQHFKDPDPLPAEISERLRPLIGPDAVETMAVLRTPEKAFFNAIALREFKPAEIWISEGLLQALSADSAAAVLLHEHSHIERRDDLRRLGWSVGLHLACVVALLVVNHPVGLVISSLIFAASFLFASTWIGQKHELVADHAAVRHGLAPAMADALEHLHRLNELPREIKNEALLTHPMLDRRIAALGIEPDRSDVHLGPVQSPR